ncbi:DMT family transporter, partial [Escherichia coli]|nr:DMT family transporter [Escherichia coli]
MTKAICWGAWPLGLKQVLGVMYPRRNKICLDLMAGMGIGTSLAVRKTVPLLRLFSKPGCLIWMALRTAGLLGNFILFSSSLQYLSPTASQVIAQLSPVGMMVASVFILKEKMRSTQVVGALMLLSGLVMFFNTSLVEIFTK